MPPSPYSHSVAVPPLRGAAGAADASLQSMYVRAGSGMSLASRHSSASYTPSDDGSGSGSASGVSDSMHRIVSDSESDGDPLVPLRMPTRAAPSGAPFPPLKTPADCDDIEPSLRTPTAAAPELPGATPRLRAQPQCTDPPSPCPPPQASASMTTLSQPSAPRLLPQRASLIIQDDGIASTPAQSPPRDADDADDADDAPLHAPASPPPAPDPLGRHLSAALPSYLKIPTIIPSSYASPSTSPLADAFPPRVVYSDQKEAAFLAASLKEVQAHDVPKPFLAPVSLTWHGRGRRVFVTGTFAHAWRSKIPLRQTREGGPFVRTLYLPPGTHRLKFIVDNRWRVSNELNTASDGDGNMVNYVEVPSVSTAARASAPEPAADAPDAPDAAWAAALADLHVQPRSSDWDEMLGDDPAAPPAADGTWTSAIPAGVELAQETEEALHEHEMDRDAPALLPTPPMMPPQLEKVILNSSPANIAGSMSVPSSVVDDTSVLPAPNHAVLNHLAASAIKNGVLAVGSVQRYKRKYVTTLLYRPVQP